MHLTHIPADEGRTVDVAIEDNCPTCAEYDLDLTMTAIKYLVDDPVFVGRLKGVTWEFIDNDGGDGGDTGCGGVAAWTATGVYTAGQKAYYGGYIWTAKWWTQGDIPGSSSELPSSSKSLGLLVEPSIDALQIQVRLSGLRHLPVARYLSTIYCLSLGLWRYILFCTNTSVLALSLSFIVHFLRSA